MTISRLYVLCGETARRPMFGFFLVYLILLGLNGKYMESGTWTNPEATGSAVGGILAFGGTLAGSPFGWASFGCRDGY